MEAQREAAPSRSASLNVEMPPSRSLCSKHWQPVSPPPRRPVPRAALWKQTLKTSSPLAPSLSEKPLFTPPPNQTHKHGSSERRPARAAPLLVWFPDEGAPSVFLPRQSGPSGAPRGRNRGRSPSSSAPAQMEELTLQRAEATSPSQKGGKREK